MKKALLVVSRPYGHNEIFDPGSPLNRDNCLLFFQELQREFGKRGYELQTSDMFAKAEADIVIYNEMPHRISKVDVEKSAVLLFESELIRPDNWDVSKHEKFKYIFTWNDSYVDNEKYFKFNFVDANQSQFTDYSMKTKLCTLVAGNKSVRHPYELYSRRVEAIRWFERFHPSDFEFFGMGWDRHAFDVPIIGKALGRITPLAKMMAKKWPSYRGPAKSKINLMQNYRFSICYENAEKIPGYITEKIFDSFAAGCVPIYWGAPNILNFVPADCFIHKPDYPSYEALYRYISEMTEDVYNRYRQAIQQYLSSDPHKKFTAEYNAKVVCDAFGI